METESYVFWAVWGAAGLCYELYAVRNERRNGALPLTRVVRDRLMARFFVIRLAVLLGLGWLGLHFLDRFTW